MADQSTSLSYRPAPGTIPESPGVYRFFDGMDRVIYVGKAKNLRSRLSSYFAPLASLHPRTCQMVTTAVRVEWVVVNTEVEALQLEYAWIKEFDPRFNVRYRDDKSYPYLAVTLNEEYPRFLVSRDAKRKGVRYFGPYPHVWAIRETLDLLLRVFPARTCSKSVFQRARTIDRPCLLGYIGKCSAPCVGRVSAEEHRRIVNDFCDFMVGRTDEVVRRLEREMANASEELEFERAARIRDDLAAVRKALEKQAIVFDEDTDADVVAFAEDPLQAAVQVFHIRAGRVRGQRGWVLEKVEDLAPGALVHHFCTQVYGDGGDPPRELLVPELPDDADALSDWLSELRGSRVRLRVPHRGDKRTFLETVARNAEQALLQHKLRRSGDVTLRGKAMEEIAEALALDSAPLRIECYDVSQLQGTDVVASLVVFEDGIPRKSEYRRFIIRGATDDLSAMSEVLRRRFSEPKVGEDGEDRRRFAYPPQLLVVDGGAPQVGAAAATLADLGVNDIVICGLAKRLEEVWLPNDEFPVILPRASEGLYLLQRLRDEAHRFAVSFHRERRSKRMTASVLDSVAGLGEIRKKALLKRFGSLKRLAAADLAEISEVPGIGPRTAESVLRALGKYPEGSGATVEKTQEAAQGNSSVTIGDLGGAVMSPGSAGDTDESDGARNTDVEGGK
ncbi:MAG: excinuclease ABC subunit UvrC [Longispora sp.]|nr:excinuclease ABC subunit UvrC [Longispora sp. (in: high G+C Gram-positive bacteria)]